MAATSTPNPAPVPVRSLWIFEPDSLSVDCVDVVNLLRRILRGISIGARSVPDGTDTAEFLGPLRSLRVSNGSWSGSDATGAGTLPFVKSLLPLCTDRCSCVKPLLSVCTDVSKSAAYGVPQPADRKYGVYRGRDSGISHGILCAAAVGGSAVGLGGVGTSRVDGAAGSVHNSGSLGREDHSSAPSDAQTPSKAPQEPPAPDP